MFHVTPAAIGNNQLTIDLPDLRYCDQIEITRVLQALTDASVGHHQHATPNKRNWIDKSRCLNPFKKAKTPHS
jgi:hypothetical protein